MESGQTSFGVSGTKADTRRRKEYCRGRASISLRYIKNWLPIAQNGFKPAASTGEEFMGEYWKAVVGHVGTAIFDVLFVAIFSLAPLLLGRLVIPLKNIDPNESYWDFLFNGQLSFFAMGSWSEPEVSTSYE